MSDLALILRNKKRSLAMFAGDDVPDDSFKKLRLEIKMANEYRKLKELPDKDDGKATPGGNQKFVGHQALLNKSLTNSVGSSGGMGMLTAGTGPGAIGMLTNGGSSSSTSTGSLSLLPAPTAAQELGPQQGPALPPPKSASAVVANIPGTQNVPKKQDDAVPSLMPDQVKLDLVRVNDNVIRLNDDNARLRALEKPQWHRPWKLHKVIAGHQGWVRCVAVDKNNEFFCTSGEDRLIKFWNLATGELKLSLTGHSATVRALEISNHHPYFYSAGEDNEVRCWDLNTNKIIRTYHGHMSAVYALKLHPTIDVLASGGRDGTVRIWDIRTRSQIFALQHQNTVWTIASQQAEPQFISGSADCTVKLWDLAAGKSMATLTNHHKSIRSISIHPSEYTFVSCCTDANKVWKCPRGQFERNIYGHSGIINASAIRDNQDGSSILVGGGDDGFLHFWDWKTGYMFQSIEGKPQPGSLSAENAIYGLAFDQSRTRLITTECDKTVKIYREDEMADEDSHPIGNWRQQLMKNKRR